MFRGTKPPNPTVRRQHQVKVSQTLCPVVEELVGHCVSQDAELDLIQQGSSEVLKSTEVSRLRRV